MVRKAIKRILEEWPTASDLIRIVDVCQKGMNPDAWTGNDFFRFLLTLQPLGLEVSRVFSLYIAFPFSVLANFSFSGFLS